MRRPSNFNGDEASRFPHAAGELPASSHRPAAGETETFSPVGTAAQAVVMRLRGGTRLKVQARAPVSATHPARGPFNQPGEEEPR